MVHMVWGMPDIDGPDGKQGWKKENSTRWISMQLYVQML